MRRTLFILLASILVLSCGRDPGEAAVERDWTRDAVVYELNTRQATAEGTFAAAQRKLPELKELGVDVVWLMPVYPIGEKGLLAPTMPSRTIATSTRSSAPWRISTTLSARPTTLASRSSSTGWPTTPLRIIRG
ncbi:MAG: hypothetical protein U0K42_08045 [Bacteroidales bacterium]|nr:hypothetical protein [Bacteroidales bacterium]